MAKNETMTVGRVVYDLKRKQTFKISWKQEFTWVTLEDLGETPDMQNSEP